MITLAHDCLLFQLASGEAIPYSADMVSVDLMGQTARLFDAEFVRHAAQAVFHYFKQELGRQTISVGEFAGAMEKVLGGFRLETPSAPGGAPGVHESDLCRLAQESSLGGELFFFPRLREEFRQRLLQNPRVLRFRGLRGCVKQLLGARRWNPRCRVLEEQIILYLQGCLSAEVRPTDFALVVE